MRELIWQRGAQQMEQDEHGEGTVFIIKCHLKRCAHQGFPLPTRVPNSQNPIRTPKDNCASFRHGQAIHSLWCIERLGV